MADKKYWGNSQLSFPELDILGLFVQKKLVGNPLPSYETMKDAMDHFALPRKYRNSNLFQPNPTSSSSSSSREDVIDLTDDNFPYFLPNGMEEETLLTSNERHLLHPVNNRNIQLYMAKSKPTKRKMSNPTKVTTSTSSSGNGGDEPIKPKRGRPRKTIQQNQQQPAVLPVPVSDPLTSTITTAAAASTASSSSVLLNNVEDLYFMENEESVSNGHLLEEDEDNVYFTVDSEQEERKDSKSQSLITTNGVIVENGINESKELFSNPQQHSAVVQADNKASMTTMPVNQVHQASNVSVVRNNGEGLIQIKHGDVTEGDTKYNHGGEPSVNGKLPSSLISPQTTTSLIVDEEVSFLAGE